MKTPALHLAVGFSLFAAMSLANCADGDEQSVITPTALPKSDNPLVFESGHQRVSLVELFTSQGCSSCPPADAYLSKKITDSDLWKKYVPVAWHVDYWDRLGWPDPFASETFTQHQYAHREAGHVDSVYTPGFVIDGKEWRGFFQRQDIPESEPAGGNSIPNLKATVDGKSARVEILWDDSHPAPAEQQGWTLHLAELGFGLKTQVPRGENSGRTLVNDFVVLNYQAKTASDSGGDDDKHAANFTLTLPKQPAASAAHRALAVWLTGKDDALVPVQATGGWLPTALAAGKP